MKKNIARRREEHKRRDRKLRARSKRILQRLDKANHDKFLRCASGAGPVLNEVNLKYELADKARGISYGGAGLMMKLAHRVGLVAAIDRHVDLLKMHCPYHESDHVLNISLNALCEGPCLQDIELRRNDEVFLDAIGVASIPDPTTAGDFCRRFAKNDVIELMHAVNEARANVWKQQDDSFFEEAVIDADGTFVITTGECKAGMDINYKGEWGYHPLLVSLANTQEPLFIVNRSGNRPSEEDAATWLDHSIKLCRKSGFRGVRLRGDTAFMQTEKLDGWDRDGVLFQFGYDAKENLKALAEDLLSWEWKKLVRPAKYQRTGAPRAKPTNIKRQIIREREYLHLELKSEEVSEFEYQPTACAKPYRMVVVRKNISQEKGTAVLFDQIRYLFYITNDRESSCEEIVFGCNDRCDQENLISHLASGVKALKAPVDNLESNWAYMVSASIAWSLKAWTALLLPVSPAHREKHEAERQSWLRMEFKGWVQRVMKIPCQIVKQSRRVIYRVLNWNPQLPAFFRLSDFLDREVLLC